MAALARWRGGYAERPRLLAQVRRLHAGVVAAAVGVCGRTAAESVPNRLRLRSCVSVPYTQMAVKLDALMTVMLEYISARSQPSVPASKREHMFHLVLGVFEKFVLLTYKCASPGAWGARSPRPSAPSLPPPHPPHTPHTHPVPVQSRPPKRCRDGGGRGAASSPRASVPLLREENRALAPAPG
jgi:hypothetical protein